ncbi:hypothetical protein CspeluHIS016_0407320 [Cutaneotrichosporon spelunceum]|uniref:Uncharacterized protein n=1 Tax=Cutaneotrichosporon spelunceum TaxID=1672016 RepID=A0AAD3TVY3_9TREE|nr:hypothetical protein CspeluHIS016_0407320 [Cutaneotrichosporon spelunceum]
MSHPTKCIQTAAIAAIAADVAADSAAKKKKQGTGLGSAMDKGEQAGPTYEEKGKAKAEPDSQPHPESWRLYKANIYKLVDELQTINKEHHQHMINHSMRRKDWSDKYETLQNWAELQEWPEELQTQVVEFTHNSSGGLEAIPEESDNDFKEHGGSSSNGQEMDLNEPLSSTSPTFHTP